MSNRPGVPPPLPGSTRRRVLAALGLGSLAGAAPIELRGADGSSAIEAMTARGLAAVESHNLALRERAYAGFAELPQLTITSVPRGPLATAIVSARLRADIDSRALVRTLREKHGLVIKRIEERWFNGIRFSPHVFNTEADVDAALAALRIELELGGAA